MGWHELDRDDRYWMFNSMPEMRNVSDMWLGTLVIWMWLYFMDVSQKDQSRGLP